MLLTIDIGNSNIVFGLPAGEGRARRLYRLGTVPERPVEEYFTLAASLFAREGVELGRVDGAVICSVVPVLVPVLSQVVQRLTGITPYIVTSRSKSGLTLAIPEGDTLGNDILAADAAAAAEYPLRGLPPEALRAAIAQAILQKPQQHTMDAHHASRSCRNMHEIGG